MTNTHSNMTRLNLPVDYHASLALERLAYFYKTSQAKVLEALISDAQNALLTTLGGDDQNAYFDKKLTRQELSRRLP